MLPGEAIFVSFFWFWLSLYVWGLQRQRCALTMLLSSWPMTDMCVLRDLSYYLYICLSMCFYFPFLLSFAPISPTATVTNCSSILGHAYFCMSFCTLCIVVLYACILISASSIVFFISHSVSHFAYSSIVPHTLHS